MKKSFQPEHPTNIYSTCHDKLHIDLEELYCLPKDIVTELSKKEQLRYFEKTPYRLQSIRGLFGRVTGETCSLK